MKTIKAILGIGVGILLGLSLISCVVVEDCYTEYHNEYDPFTDTIITVETLICY